MTHEGYSDPEKRQQRAGRTLLNEWAQPEDIVGMVLFLASDMARYITGQSIYIDGGWTAKGI
jgi:gluconate 5-dehydrogenase